MADIGLCEKFFSKTLDIDDSNRAIVNGLTMIFTSLGIGTIIDSFQAWGEKSYLQTGIENLN